MLEGECGPRPVKVGRLALTPGVVRGYNIRAACGGVVDAIVARGRTEPQRKGAAWGNRAASTVSSVAPCTQPGAWRTTDRLKATNRQAFELTDVLRRCVRSMWRRLDCHFATKTNLCMLMVYPASQTMDRQGPQNSQTPHEITALAGRRRQTMFVENVCILLCDSIFNTLEV